jgi:hypothetical protein
MSREIFEVISELLFDELPKAIAKRFMAFNLLSFENLLSLIDFLFFFRFNKFTLFFLRFRFWFWQRGFLAPFSSFLGNVYFWYNFAFQKFQLRFFLLKIFQKILIV